MWVCADVWEDSANQGWFIKKKKQQQQKTGCWSRSRLKFIPGSNCASIRGTNTVQKLLQQRPDSRDAMRDFHGADCFQAAGCSKTTLCNHSKLSERTHGYLLLSVSSDSYTHRSVPTNHAAVHSADHQCRSEQQYMIKDTFSQVGPVLNEHPDPRTGSPSSRGRQHHHTHRSEKRGCVEIDTTANTQYTHHITNGGDVSDSHLVYSVPLTAIFIK